MEIRMKRPSEAVYGDHFSYEAVRTLRRSDKPYAARIPIIAMTANAFDEDKKNARAAGMNDHLAKPFRIEKLYEMMKKYL